MTNTSATKSYVDMMLAEGWQVWMRDAADNRLGLSSEYAYCTDGTHIAYVQWSDLGHRVSTVHKPNRTTGTGFNIAESISPEAIQRAAVCFAPNWADERDRLSVKKYKDWNEFHNENSFNKQLREVTA